MVYRVGWVRNYSVLNCTPVTVSTVYIVFSFINENWLQSCRPYERTLHPVAPPWARAFFIHPAVFGCWLRDQLDQLQIRQAWLGASWICMLCVRSRAWGKFSRFRTGFPGLATNCCDEWERRSSHGFFAILSGPLIRRYEHAMAFISGSQWTFRPALTRAINTCGEK